MAVRVPKLHLLLLGRDEAKQDSVGMPHGQYDQLTQQRPLFGVPLLMPSRNRRRDRGI